MRRLSSISALAAGALAVIFGIYARQGSPLARAGAAQEAFSPNALMIDANLKSESWDPF